MKKNLIFIFLISLGLTLFNTACNDFLDVMPDNRTMPDTDNKIAALLVNAYSLQIPNQLIEYMSDNVDERHMGSIDKSMEQAYLWEEITETPSRDSPKALWADDYLAIAHANQALQAIHEAGDPERLNPHKGEALICRAYYHFMLVNVFALHYNASTSEEDLGIVYMEAPETSVNPQYKRESVADVYRKIARDIEEGLPLINNSLYNVPKFHFNKNAALAFAARFYLYYGNYDKVLEYTNALFGDNPKPLLRDMSGYPVTGVQPGTIPSGSTEEMARYYTSAEQPANLLLLGAYTGALYTFGSAATNRKCSHSIYLAETETFQTPKAPWGEYTASTFYIKTRRPTSSSTTEPQNVVFVKYPNHTYASGGGYIYRSVYPAFQTGETILCRAEAYIMKGDFANATKDLAIWMKLNCTTSVVLTEQLIMDTYSIDRIPYYEPKTPTIRKKLNITPAPTAKQEVFLQCLLHFRRIETMHEGLRWFDIKRFGIKIYRRSLTVDNIVTVTDELDVNDPRRAMQLPQDVIIAGLEANPRP
jgi:tetratricopeptide (TPR) repeat protein